MAKRNKKKLKQRRKRQLRKQFKQVSKPIIQPVVITYQTALDKKYGGNVKAMESYINPRASLFHYCKRCGVEFYGKPSHMLGKDSQKHLCTLPYGDCHGERLSRVKRNYISKGNKNKNKNADKQGNELANKLDELINQGLSTLNIRQQTGVEPRIIEYYKQTFHSRD